MLQIQLKIFMAKPISIKIIKSDDPNYTKDNPQRRCPDLSLIKKFCENIFQK